MTQDAFVRDAFTETVAAAIAAAVKNCATQVRPGGEIVVGLPNGIVFTVRVAVRRKSNR